MKSLDSYLPLTDKHTHQYLSINIPFEIDPNKFIEWLKETGEKIDYNNYSFSVTSMCEYACLWITKLAYDIKLSPDRLYVCYGSYAYYPEHYWIMLDNKYFIDLTLAQFEKKAPKLAVTDKNKACGKNAYSKGYYKTTYLEYVRSFIPELNF